MSKTLILMRHAKAQRPAENETDIERELSEAGKRSLTAELPNALKLLPADASVAIWSSPAARAMGTAHIAEHCCQKLGIKTEAGVEIVNALWHQDLDALLADVRNSNNDIVLAVGHEPFISMATAQLTGSHIYFTTGGITAISLGSDPAQTDSPSANRLLWFVQGPVSQRWKTLVQIERIIGKAGDTVKERMEAFASEPEDPETNHKLRVSIRTLRSLVSFIAPWQERTQNKAMREDLKAIVAETSRLRELDVFAQQASGMEGSSAEFIAFCADAAVEERARTAKALSSKRMQKRFDRAISETRCITWRKGICAHGLGADEVRARFDGLTASLAVRLDALDPADAEETHDVRKKAKQVRYAAEQFSSLLGDDALGIAKAMVAHQDDLGAMCDARVNIGIIESLSSKTLADEVAWDLALMRAQNETFLYTALRDKRPEAGIS